MIKVAYSYMRFSNPQQATGDSRRRQLAMGEKYAAEHGLTLDRHLSFRDLGVSAFRGKNAKEGALCAFLEAIDHNLVPWGSYLLIESLDRLSRDRILAAQALFLQIIQAGVTIVTLTDQRLYSLESINQNPLDLVVSLVVLMRANEESEMKSRRIRAAFEVMRSKLAEEPWTARCPGWLRLDKTTGKFAILEERANIVRRIFRESLSGIGRETIARRLNEERVPLFGQGNQRDKHWQKTLIRHLLYTPAVMGTLVPFVSEWVEGVQRLRPQPPVEHYFPAIIDPADWDRVQARRAAWVSHSRCDVPKTLDQLVADKVRQPLPHPQGCQALRRERGVVRGSPKANAAARRSTPPGGRTGSPAYGVRKRRGSLPLASPVGGRRRKSRSSSSDGICICLGSLSRGWRAGRRCGGFSLGSLDGPVRLV
jgi:DNA invertase Pin-like site-specific DNA recombinase